MSAAEFIVESAHKYKNNLGIIAIGPLTNIAFAYLISPVIKDEISVLSIMGGAFTGLGIRHFFAA
jgi:purine nucleosidase